MGPFGIFEHPFCCKISKKIEGDSLEKNKFSKKMPKNWKGDPLGFNNIHSVAKHQKIEGRPFEEFFFKKSLTMPKKLKGHPLGFSTSILSQNIKN